MQKVKGGPMLEFKSWNEFGKIAGQADTRLLEEIATMTTERADIGDSGRCEVHRCKVIRFI